jgi:hypothetical protein
MEELTAAFSRLAGEGSRSESSGSAARLAAAATAALSVKESAAADPAEPPPIETDKWTPWTDASKDVVFESTVAGQGDGENKVAAELGTSPPKGQNSSYDLEVLIGDVTYHADVKKLDGNSFNTGVTGRDALRPIKEKITSFLGLHPEVELSPDELAVKSLEMLYKMFAFLHARKKFLLPEKTYPLFDCITGAPKEVSALQLYTIATANGTDEATLRTLLEDSFDGVKEVATSLLHPYIDNPLLLKEELEELKHIFEGELLIFVDKVKGFYIMTDPDEKVIFQRITRGHPRFKVAL